MGHRGRISLTQLTLLFVGLMGITAVLALVEGNLTLAAIVMALTIAAIGASAVVQYYGGRAEVFTGLNRLISICARSSKYGLV